MKWSLNNKANINNIEQLGTNKFILNLSQTKHTPKQSDEWDNYDTQFFEVQISGIPSTARIKQELLNLQKAYDASDEVNSFVINGIKTWLDRNTRIALKNSVSVMESKGETSYQLWLNNSEMTLPISVIKSFLDILEVYAIQAFNVTQQHIAQINNLNNVEDLFTFDVSAGYPQKINLII